MKKQIDFRIVSLVFSVLVVCFAIVFYVVAWEEPGSAPPGGNVPAPLNVGVIEQTKEGNLVVNALGISATGNALLIPNGNVGIGTTSPGAKLHVSKSTIIEGANIDPNVMEADFSGFNKGLYIGWNRSGGWGEVDFISDRSGGSIGGFRFYDKDNSNNINHLMTIKSDGNVGIGTVSPSEKLEVDGAIKVGNTTGTNAGTIRWTGTAFEGYSGTSWVPLGGGGTRITSGSYTGDRTVNRPIAHGLGVVPVFVMITSYNTIIPDAGGDFFRIHEGLARIFRVNDTNDDSFSVLAPDSTNFYVGRSGEYSATANTTVNYYWVAFGE